MGQYRPEYEAGQIAQDGAAVMSSPGINLLRLDRPKRATPLLDASESSDRRAQGLVGKP